MAEDIETTKKDDVDVESQIQTAMLSRVPHFKQQADSLTFEGVRRLLEKDLGFEEYSLDSHKRFIKQCLEKCLEEVGDDDASKMSGEEEEKGESTQEAEGKKEERQSKDEKDLTEDEEKMEDSPVLGLLKEQKRVKNETKKAEGNGKKVVPNEALIKKAIIKRSSYLKANADEVTVAGLRRLLEEDLKLDKFSLDPYKKFIRQQLDEVLTSSEVPEPAKSAKKIVKKKPDSKATKKVSTEENSDTSDKASEEEESQEDEVKPKKTSVPKGKASVGPKKRKGEETKSPNKKRVKLDKEASEDNSDAEDDGKNSEDDQSHSSAENTKQKKQVSTPVVYSKRVEHLKSVIKACGMSVPPVIYKKVKQVPENKREGQLIKELEEILSKEGLSSNPSEKEIKEVKRKKERAKELEGIDMSNIVSSTRRRVATSFAAPPPPKPKPKTPVKTSGKDTEGSDNDKCDEVNDNEVNDNEEDEEDEEEEDSSDDDGSQSEEFNDDEEDSD